MRAPATIVAAALLVLAGCGSSADPVPKAKLGALVLHQGDVAAAFQPFDEGAQVGIDAVAGPRHDPARFGREGGWKARYHRSGTAATSGPLVIESRADLFADAGGAKDDLDAYRRQFEQTPAARVVPVETVGAAAVASTQLQAGSPGVRYYTVAWRDRNVTASVTVNGFEGKLALADALALARRQERRISDS